MLKTARALLACMTLLLALSGCWMLPRTTTLPDPTVPHRVAAETSVQIEVRRPDGQLTTEEVRLLKGWWIAAPPIVEPLPPIHQLGLSPKGVDP